MLNRIFKNLGWGAVSLLLFAIIFREGVGLWGDIDFAVKEYKKLGGFGAVMEFILEPPPGAFLVGLLLLASLLACLNWHRLLLLVMQRPKNGPPLLSRRKRHISSEFSKLSPKQKSALQYIFDAGHARNIDPSDWNALLSSGFVESNFSGPLGIKKDIENYVEKLLEGYKGGATLKKQHEVRLSDALHWIIDNSDWGPGLGHDSFLELAARVIRQAAKDGEITIQGRRELPGYEPDGQFDDIWDDIEQSYWQTHKFEMTAVMCAKPHYAIRETMVVSSGDVNAEAMPHYAMLRVWRDELERRWPAANS